MRRLRRGRFFAAFLTLAALVLGTALPFGGGPSSFLGVFVRHAEAGERASSAGVVNVERLAPRPERSPLDAGVAVVGLSPRPRSDAGAIAPKEVIGLYYFRNRYLDPEQGRFVTRDPIGVWGDPGNLGNAYAFAGGNPVNRRDPFGLWGQHWYDPFGWFDNAPANGAPATPATPAPAPAPPTVPVDTSFRDWVESDPFFNVARPDVAHGIFREGPISGVAYAFVDAYAADRERGFDPIFGDHGYGYNEGAELRYRAAMGHLALKVFDTGTLLLPVFEGLGAAGRLGGACGRVSTAVETRAVERALVERAPLPEMPGPPRTAGLAETASLEDLIASGAVPGEEGVTLTNSWVRYRDLWRLSQRIGGYEVKLVRMGGRYRVLSGGRSSVRVPMTIERNLAHVHPQGTRLPSPEDIAVMDSIWERQLAVDPAAPCPKSRVVWGPGPTDSTIYRPAGLR